MLAASKHLPREYILIKRCFAYLLVDDASGGADIALYGFCQSKNATCTALRANSAGSVNPGQLDVEHVRRTRRTLNGTLRRTLRLFSLQSLYSLLFII